MAITEKQLAFIRDELDTAKRPLFLHDDDPDGLVSFLLLYRYCREGKRVMVNSTPEVKEMYLRYVDEYGPDKIFVLDKPKISQEFIDGCNVPIIMIDHHEPIENDDGIKYFNPRLGDDKDNRPTSYWCYKVVEQDLWLATVGCVSDWFLPDFIDKFKENYPDLLDSGVDTAQEALFNSRLGELCRAFSFIMKGKSNKIKKYINTLMKINDPYEILEEKTPAGKLLFKRFKEVDDEYKELISKVEKGDDDDKLLFFDYSERNYSFTSDLSNEMLYRHPDKVILICREKSGKMHCSLRSTNIDLPTIVNESLSGLDGYGGGHLHACGVSVRKEDFDIFLERLKKSI